VYFKRAASRPGQTNHLKPERPPSSCESADTNAELAAPGRPTSTFGTFRALPACSEIQNEITNVTDELEYLAHRLVIIEQPGGGFLVEVTPIAGGQTIRTMTYQRTQEAIAASKRTIDKHPEGRRPANPVRS
jgi:hypothetical protein